MKLFLFQAAFFGYFLGALTAQAATLSQQASDRAQSAGQQGHSNSSITNINISALQTPTLLFDWKSSLSGIQSQNETDKANIVDFRLQFKFNYNLNSKLVFNFSPVFKMQSGQKNVSDSADKPENKILLYQAGAFYNPTNYLGLAAGALNQRTLHTSLFVEEMSFPAARLITQISPLDQGLNAKLAYELAVPTSTTLSSNTQDQEKTPTLNTLSSQIRYTKSKTQFVELNIGYFEYSDLPSEVAAQSGLSGNSIELTSESHGRFLYRYKGIESALKASLDLAKASNVEAGIESVYNTEAPTKYNTALLGYVEGQYALNSQFNHYLRSSYFRIEPDSVVSYYASKKYFQSNRIGYSIETGLRNLTDRYGFSIRYTEAQVLFLSPSQSLEKSIMLKLETTYADL